jgi:hypothetical protein
MKTLPDDHVITINDARRKGLCVRGLMTWAAANGLDKREMVRSGFTVGELRRLNDGFGNLLIERLERDE